MVITRELAQPIVDKLEEVLDNPVNIIDHAGIVVASSEADRVGSYHQGAVNAMKNREDLLVYPVESEKLKGTRRGITLPIQFHGEYVGALGITGEPDELMRAASIIKVAVVSLIEQAYLTQQANYKRKILDNWVANLIAERLEDEEHLRGQARFLGLDIKKSCSVLVVSTKPIVYNEFAVNEQYIQQAAGQYLRIHFFAYVGQGLYVMAVRVRSEADAEYLPLLCEAVCQKLAGINQQSYIGVGKPRSELSGYRQSYFDALQSVRILERLGGEKRVIYYYEHQIFRLLESIPAHTKDAFINNYLDDKAVDRVLFETLAAYFELDRRINETAEALHVHRNTLIFRLNKVKDVYGLDPRSFRDAVTLQMLLYLLKFPGLRRSGGEEQAPRAAGAEMLAL